MRAILVATILGLAAAGPTTPADAQSRAVMVGNAAGSLDAQMVAAGQALHARGFAISAEGDLTSGQLRQQLAQLQDMAGSDRAVIALEGQFVHAGQQTWFLGAEARGATPPPSLATAGGMGVALETVMQIASQAPGGAIVLLGSDDRKLALGPGVTQGVGELAIPPGVVVFQGTATEISAFAAGDLIRSGKSLIALAIAHPALRVAGILPPGPAFPPAPPAPSADAEDAAWKVTRAANSAAALKSFLSQFPDGQHAEAARAALAQMQADPFRAQRQAEDALDLTRDQRGDIQRALALLGHDPQGIDGIFGPNTRDAIRDWQAAQGIADPSGYLTAGQVSRLTAQAEKRAAELQAQADARQAAQDREDRAYWAQTGAKGGAAALQAYLKRYPDGLYADTAEEQLDRINARRQAKAKQQERAVWQHATKVNSVASYKNYLKHYPQGAFADAANNRIERLQNQETPAEKAAKAREDALHLTRDQRKRIEERLAALKFDPGRVDGHFDLHARRAIRRLQRSAGLPVTGYLDRLTAALLLARLPE